MLTRREFIKQFGIALFSLLATGCMRPGEDGGIPRGRLRDCWLGLDALAKRAANDMEAAQGRRSALIDKHRSALDDLVSAGELDASVADLVQIAFEETSYHVWRQNAPVTCYIALPSTYHPSADLTAQAAALSEAADLDPETLKLARMAIARDVVLLGALSAEGADQQQLVKLWRAEQIPVDEQALQAAQFLVDLLLGDGAKL